MANLLGLIIPEKIERSFVIMSRHTDTKQTDEMPIKYPQKYQPKYYNPNWGPYDINRITWEYHERIRKQNAERAKAISKNKNNNNNQE